MMDGGDRKGKGTVKRRGILEDDWRVGFMELDRGVRTKLFIV